MIFTAFLEKEQPAMVGWHFSLWTDLLSPPTPANVRLLYVTTVPITPCCPHVSLAMTTSVAFTCHIFFHCSFPYPQPTSSYWECPCFLAQHSRPLYVGFMILSSFHLPLYPTLYFSHIRLPLVPRTCMSWGFQVQMDSDCLGSNFNLYQLCYLA